MRRARITITLQNSVITHIDSLVDKKTIRNRSHAIEYILTEHFNSNVTKAVILAGGKGTNLRPYTYEIPKSLLPIKGKPILEYLIENCKKSNIVDIIICIGYLGDKIKEHFGNGERFGVKITYLTEKNPLLTGGALKKARQLLSDSSFILLYGDIITDLVLGDLISFHKNQNGIATIALTTVDSPTTFGQLKLHGTMLTNFYQKAQKNKVESNLINCGMYVFEPDIFSFFPKQDSFSLEDVIETLIKKKKVSGFVFEGQWYDVGTPEHYEEAIQRFKT